MSSVMDQGNRTFIGSVVFVDIVGYSKKSVSDQITMKDRFTSLLSDSLKDIAADQRIILDTGDGAALSFIGDPEDALFVSMNMRDFLKSLLPNPADLSTPPPPNELSLRIGINLGPIKLVRDINGQPNIVGDGINVAQRIMSFARPGQVVVSRSYFDVVSVISDEYAQLFKYEGSRTDKHVREHEIYVVGESVAAFNKAKSGMEDRAAATNPRNKANATIATRALAEPDADGNGDDADVVPLMQDKKKLGMIGGALGAVVILLAILVATKKTTPVEPIKDATAIAAITTAAAPAVGVPPTTPTPDATKPADVTDTAKPTDPVAALTTPPTSGATTAATPAPTSTTDGKTASPTSPTSPASPAATANSKTDATKTIKTDASKTEQPKSAVQGNLNFAISPWGEVLVNGRSIGTTPPLKQHKLAPGKYKIEVRNSTFTPHIINVDVKSKEDITVKHVFK